MSLQAAPRLSGLSSKLVANRELIGVCLEEDLLLRSVELPPGGAEVFSKEAVSKTCLLLGPPRVLAFLLLNTER